MEALNHVKSSSLSNSSHSIHNSHSRDGSPVKHNTQSNDGLEKNHTPKITSVERDASSKHKDGLKSSSNHSKDRMKHGVDSSSSSSSPKPSTPNRHKDGSVRSKDHHHSNSKSREHSSGSIKHREHSNSHSSSSGSIPKPREGNFIKVKCKDGSIKYREVDSKGNVKPRDPNAKPRDPNLTPSSKVSSNSSNSLHKSKDPNLKHKDPNFKSKDPNLKPKDPNLKPKDPNLKSKDPNLKPKDPNLKPKDPHKKLKEGYIRMKDGSIRPKDSHSKSNSSPSIKPKDPNRQSSSSSSRPDKMKDGSTKKPSSGDSKSTPVIKKEKRPDSVKIEVKKEGHSVKKADGSVVKKHSLSSEGSKMKVKSQVDVSGKVRHKEEVTKKKTTDSPVKLKMEPGVRVKTEDGSSSRKLSSPIKSVKSEPESEEDDVPLNERLQPSIKKSSPVKRPHQSDNEDDEPLTARLQKVKKQKRSESEVVQEVKENVKKRKPEDDDDFDEKPLSKKKKLDHTSKKKKKKDKKKKGQDEKPAKKKKKEEEVEVWKWWEETPLPEGVKWKFLEHRGPVFAPPYERVPADVKFFYDGKHIVLSEWAEEVAGFYARMLDHEYTTKSVFNKNFFKDWRKSMTSEEHSVITDLRKCNFTRMHKYFLAQSELRKNRTKEEKQVLKKQNEDVLEEYGFCVIDGHKEKIGNFKIEPPGLFRGRGNHPKMGMLKKRTRPQQVTINCSKDAHVPDAPGGTRWKSVIHDNTVTWLCSWTENIQGSNKYVMLNPSSRLKGEKDWMKYETARKLKKRVIGIRDEYRQDWKSKEMRIRQRAVALYFIDKLALRAGNEKEEGESADTVGCCSLRVEHTKLHEVKDGKEFVVEFDFLGKDSIRYQNEVPVEKRVFKNLQLFVVNKQGEDDLFDRLNTTILNKYLQDLMEGLTAKVFRTYNASITLQDQLKALTVSEDAIPSKVLAYNRANRAVAILCNHQRAAPKTFDKQMANLQEKVDAKNKAIKEAKKDLKAVKMEYKKNRNEKMKQLVDRKKSAVDRLEDQLSKLEMKAVDKEENKEIALGTSKLNYLDPRISVAWCKKWEVPMEKVYNRTQRDKFRWAIDMAEDTYEF